MRKSNLLNAFLGTAIVAFCLTSCNSCNQKEAGYELVEADSLDVAPIIARQDEGAMKLTKGPVWDTWKKLHKACMENQFFKKPVYLGLSNTVDLGSVYSRSGEILQWDFNKLFSEQDRKKVITFGQPQPCSYTEQLKVNFEAFIATEIPNVGVDGELSTAIRNQKDISVKIDNWQIDRIVNRELKILLDASTDPKVAAFRKDLQESKVIMVSQAARINGFTSVINLNSEISASLEAKLKEGIVKNIGNTEAKIRFEYSTAKQIKVTSLGNFVVFVEFIKGKKVYN